MSDLFNEEIISQATHTKWAGKTVHFARETDSTNLWGKRAWREEGAGHGELFVAEYQSAGRGRFTRRWSAPPDSAITMSILICPEFSPQKAPMLTLVMGLSVAQAVAELGLEVGIKWPNDVVVSRKKICGILTEMTMKQDKIGCAVIGVGINVNMESFPEEMADKATSLYHVHNGLSLGKIDPSIEECTLGKFSRLGNNGSVFQHSFQYLFHG